MTRRDPFARPLRRACGWRTASIRRLPKRMWTKNCGSFMARAASPAGTSPFAAARCRPTAPRSPKDAGCGWRARRDPRADLLAPDKPRYSEDMSLEGRLAFYTNGKFKNGWSLTASADTREGPLDEIFSNFMDKSPEALFRRIDPDYRYPTFGDDGPGRADAPTP